MVFSFFWIFCTSLLNQVEHTWLKPQLHICNYEWAEILFVDKGLDSKLQHYGLCIISWKKSKNSHSNHSSHIEGDIMQNHEQKEKWKKLKIQDSMDKRNFFLSTLTFSPWAVSATWLHSSSKNTGKMNLIPVLNKISPRAHTESELDVLGVPEKLVKYVVHSSKGKNWKENIFLHTSYPNNNWPVFGLKEF
jgi:hypothetical protein